MDFPKVGHFWFDSGLVGLDKILSEVNADIKVERRESTLTIEGNRDIVQNALGQAYDILVDRYYNISTQKQKDDTSSYNFYYDSKEDRFHAFPRKKACGIAEIIYNKAPRPTCDSVKWEKKSNKKLNIEYKGKIIRRITAQLPESYAHLQDRMDAFLNEHGIDITTAGLLIDGPYAVKPKVKIKVDIDLKKIKGNCYFCGQPAENLEEASQTTFPLITGTSGVLSFNSMAQSPERVCWKCSFLGKFVPVNGFYYTSGDNTFAFFPYSSSLNKMLDVFAPLHEAEYLDPNHYRNFDHNIVSYLFHPFEVAFAFLYTLYKKVLLHEKGEEDEFEALDWEKLYDLTLNKASLEFYVFHARKEGSTFAVKTIWPFRETYYFYRLLNLIEGSGIKVKEVFRLLIDYQQKNENSTLMRNRICERILKKKSILDLVEIFVYKSEKKYIKPIVDFLLIYEKEVRGDSYMTKEEQDAAVTLGRRIGSAVGKSDSGKKGDLYSLRKARKKVDFLEQINRIQFKLGKEFIVPPDVYEGKLNNENFSEFKQFCMIAALNSYNAATSETKK